QAPFLDVSCDCPPLPGFEVCFTDGSALSNVNLGRSGSAAVFADGRVVMASWPRVNSYESELLAAALAIKHSVSNRLQIFCDCQSVVKVLHKLLQEGISSLRNYSCLGILWSID